VKRQVPRLDGPARAAARGELIGLPVRVVAAADAGLVGLEGTVVDETLRTLVVRRPGGRESRLGKRGAAFEFRTAKGPVRIDGAALEFRPEDRTKKVR
jgi:ribonuclease P protein subunit POP4